MENATQLRTAESLFHRLFLSRYRYMACQFVCSGAGAARAVDGKATTTPPGAASRVRSPRCFSRTVVAAIPDVFVAVPLSSQVGCNAAMHATVHTPMLQGVRNRRQLVPLSHVADMAVCERWQFSIGGFISISLACISWAMSSVLLLAAGV